ncbi:MAG TPA: extracellular solute-binding protein [Gemmatimonadaceae bacterium]|nr:extracellular solute-binding protein [Gemmatimonadaceae bacterium]
MMRIVRIVRTLAALLPAVALACGGDGRTVLTVYSPHGKDLLSYFETEFEQANPDVDVQWMDMGSQEVLDRIRAEGANPQADIWFGAPGEAFDRAAGENLLHAYRPSWADAIEPEGRGANDSWYATYRTPEVIAYNTEALTAEEAPQDWDDVLDPKWRGRVIIRDPIASGTMRAIFGAIIAREMARTGSPEAGYDWLRRLDANTREYVLNPTILYQKLGRQEGIVTLWDMPDIATLQQRVGIPVGYVIPESGTPLLYDGIAIVRGTDRLDTAQRFYEFVTTEAALTTAAERFLRIPARRDIPEEALPAWIREANEQIRPMPVDRALMAAHLDEWMRYWDANIRNRSRRR